ncbi:cytochrome P450 [Streptomyces sp. JJ38]|uniref:cytochrome P450 n=1 Tax=Streptomyces sp. JJ38 TaxID=2738128 RepID=UPI001C569B8E|nr:cytochrome P450 [Streptomyces sp. JJ38]MBW1596390.1 cytochrome P450 [Streptomyces sp. JJ38]
MDSTLALAAEGYAWLPDRWRTHTGPVVRTRLLGHPAVGLRGPEAVRFFYDDRHVARRAALPEPVMATLFGRGGVQSLDGEAHRERKALLMDVVSPPERVEALAEGFAAAWEEALPGWLGDGRIVLFDEAGVVLTLAVARWAGVPLAGHEARPLAADLLAMVDGFATAGPRHWRGRKARVEREAWLVELVEGVRSGEVETPRGSALERIATHRNADGEPLEPHVAAVEVLNVLRPTAAVAWYAAFAAHALHRWPRHRERLGEAAYAYAFADEVRRFYPFAPFVAGRAVTDLTWHGEPIPYGSLLLLDLYGQNHERALWGDPYIFRPDRFLGGGVDPRLLVPQGGGDPESGHRCPGESATRSLIAAVAARLAELSYAVPSQDLTIPLGRIPTRPRSGMVLSNLAR